MFLVEPSLLQLVLGAQQVILQTQMARFCHSIRPPGCAEEPPPPEGSLYLAGIIRLI